jgi:uncharacterized protein (TIGR02118 family)
MNPYQELDMKRLLLSFGLAALAAACSKPAPEVQQPAAPAGVQWALVVLYAQPKDTVAFEKYYAETHLPLLASHAKELGATRGELLKFGTFTDGKPAAFYREADMRWDSQAAMEKALESEGWKAVAADIPKFATGGFSVMIGMKTN